jgi:hypothetical protein
MAPFTPWIPSRIGLDSLVIGSIPWISQRTHKTGAGKSAPRKVGKPNCSPLPATRQQRGTCTVALGKRKSRDVPCNSLAPAPTQWSHDRCPRLPMYDITHASKFKQNPHPFSIDIYFPVHYTKNQSHICASVTAMIGGWDREKVDCISADQGGFEGQIPR